MPDDEACMCCNTYLQRLVLVSCKSGQLLRLTAQNKTWTVMESLAMEKPAYIKAVGSQGSDVVFEADRVTYLWRAGEKTARPISRSFYKNYVITANGNVLAWDDQGHAVVRMGPTAEDEENFLELDHYIIALAYDPVHDLIAISVDGGQILIYSSDSQLLFSKEFKVINKVYAPLYTGVPSLTFQDELLKIEAPGGAVYFQLPAERILKRYCDLQRNKDMAKEYWQKICGQS